MIWIILLEFVLLINLVIRQLYCCPLYYKFYFVARGVGMACNAIGSYGCATVGASVPPIVGYLPFWMKQHCGQQSIGEKKDLCHQR